MRLTRATALVFAAVTLAATAASPSPAAAFFFPIGLVLGGPRAMTVNPHRGPTESMGRGYTRSRDEEGSKPDQVEGRGQQAEQDLDQDQFEGRRQQAEQGLDQDQFEGRRRQAFWVREGSKVCHESRGERQFRSRRPADAATRGSC